MIEIKFPRKKETVPLLKSVSKEAGHSIAVPRREASKHVRKEGRDGGGIE